MAIATGTALAIGAIAGAGSSLLGAKMQSSAAQNAAQTQANAAQQALALQGQMYRQQQQNLAPFMQTGTQAGQALGNFLGIGAPGAGGVPTPSPFGRAPGPGPTAVPRLSMYAGTPAALPLGASGGYPTGFSSGYPAGFSAGYPAGSTPGYAPGSATPQPWLPARGFAGPGSVPSGAPTLSLYAGR